MVVVGALVCASLLGGCAQKYRSELVSINAAGNNSASRESGNFSFTPDGNKIVFDSTSADLVSPTTPAEQSLVYIRDLTTRTTRLVSVNAAGTGPANRQAHTSALSPDGTKVAFLSSATNMGTPTDGDNVVDVFVRDLVANTTTLVSVNAAGDDGGSQSSQEPVWSPDGTKIAFRSFAWDLGPTDTNTAGDIYVRDLVAGTTTLVTVNAEGTDSGDKTPGEVDQDAVFSPDSQRIAFASRDTDLVPGGTTGQLHVYLRDLGEATTTLVSPNGAGAPATNGASYNPVFSPDGQWLVFESQASNLGPTDTNDLPDVYARNLAAGTTSLVSVNTAGTAGGAGNSALPVFQPGTTKVAFNSASGDLASNDTNGTTDIFLRDLVAGTTQLLTVRQPGGRSANSY